jgi:hypothetical protein
MVTSLVMESNFKQISMLSAVLPHKIVTQCCHMSELSE